MASFNKVILLGNLTRDPQVKYTTGGTAVAEVGLAVNRTWFDKQSNTKKEETTFVDVTLWGRTAEIAGEYLAKGRSVLIEGRLQLDTWDDRETGQKRSKMRVVGENMTMLGSRGDGGGGAGGRPPAAAARDQGGADRGGGDRGGGDQGGGDQGGFSQEADSYQSPSYEDTSSGPASGPPSDEVPF